MSQQQQYPHQQMQRTTPTNSPSSAPVYSFSSTQNSIRSPSSQIGIQQPTSASPSSPQLRYSTPGGSRLIPSASSETRQPIQHRQVPTLQATISSSGEIGTYNSATTTGANLIDNPISTVARSSSTTVISSCQPDSTNPLEAQPYTPRIYHAANYITPSRPYYNQQAPYYFTQPVPSHCPSPYTALLLAQNNNYCNYYPQQQCPIPRIQNPGQPVVLHHYPQHQTRAKEQMSQQQQQQTLTVVPGPKLIWLLFMHRHGDRAPLNMAPRDKYNNTTYWPEGFGNLNNAGRLRMFKVGKYIRTRYENFLTDNIREVYSRSSDVDRCIESSHAVLAGLYPPTSRFEWNKQLLWIPAPVHTVPAPEDYLLNEAGRKYMVDLVNEIHIVQSSEAVKKLYLESVKERALLEKELGYEYDMFYKFKCTYSTLDIEERSGLAMPDWYTPELKQKLYRFAGIAFGLAGGGTEKLKKIRCSHLLDDMVSRMEMASIDGPKLSSSSDFHQPTNAPSDDDRKIVHYSTHDSIMAAFLEALNINTPTPIPPGFGATFFIELYVDLNEQGLPISEKYIKLFYMDDTDSENPIEKKLPASCLDEQGRLTLNRFKKYIGHLLPDTPSVVI